MKRQLLKTAILAGFMAGSLAHAGDHAKTDKSADKHAEKSSCGKNGCEGKNECGKNGCKNADGTCKDPKHCTNKEHKHDAKAEKTDKK